MKNSIRAIHPYWDKGLLVFDDEAVGLVKEPFVANADYILGFLAAANGVVNWKKGFTVVFSDRAFPAYHAHLTHVREEQGGNWYRSETLGEEGWLCPALYKYFDVAPQNLYLQFKETVS